MGIGRHAVALGTAAAAVALFAACGNDTLTGGDPSAACDAYYDALFSQLSKCAGLTLPADVSATDKTRFHTLCVQTISYPGEGFNATSVGTCASAMGNAACRGANPDSAGACADGRTGSLAVGTACNDGSQCQSGYCNKTTSGDGGLVPDCGTCAATVAVGQPCQPTDHCAPTSDCVKGTCVAYGTVDVGGDCAATQEVCKSGLTCDPQSKKCAALGAAGATCSSDSSCQAGLSCIKQACSQPLAAGTDCTTAPFSCALGLACDVHTKKCATLTYAKPDAPCGYLSAGPTICTPGDCNVTDAVNFTGTCPQVIPDGQSCSLADKTKTCDEFATCDNMVCTLTKTVCK